MSPISRSLAFVAIALVVACSPIPETGESPAKNELSAYVSRPDASYAWRVRSSGMVDNTDYVELILTSQQWRGTLWQHQLYLIKPASIEPGTRHALLFIGGGRWKPELAGDATEEDLPSNAEVFAGIAELLKTPVAVLRQVPFQPLFDGLKEDDLIAFSFERYLDTGEKDWPLLLPMVKSAVRAMDAIQDYADAEWGVDIETFTVTGASKRGWTTWLTGAVDRRATAIIPMVIDLPDMDRQMDHARATWGETSEKIQPYTERKLLDRLDTAEGQSLLDIVDPYSYFDALKQPKLIINATNDAYWPLDALNLYWNDLQGPKYVLYIPNNGHSVKDFVRLVGGIAAMQEHVVDGLPLPEFHWRFNENADSLTLALQVEPAPSRVLVWTARSSTRDYRKASWNSSVMEKQGDEFVVELPRPAEGTAAIFGEVFYEHLFTAPLHLSTNVRILESTTPVPNRQIQALSSP